MNTTTHPTATPDDVLHYWFGQPWDMDWPAVDRDPLWFGGGAVLDADITARFSRLVQTAQAGGLHDWEGPLHHRLALILLLDQFSRNVHRGRAGAFAGDARAQRLVLQTLALSACEDLPVAGRVFLFMPLMHAENRALQDECVQRFEALVQGSTPALAQQLQGYLRSARQHRDIIERFGRFPHRNAALGRTSTPAEEAFLTDGPRFGQ